MSAIDVQNAKQIRDPMDVLITLSLGTDIAMTYSGYSSAKVSDGVLNQSSWPMRGLADLQGNGFPLDGSRVLYNPNTSPSQTNGKLGVRGNVGQPVSVTATGNDTIAALAISVTGAASVTLNGETTEITGSHVTLQLLNTTATLTFQPSSEDRRVEIITVLPEADFIINNDNLIKATVSLRSDLSIIDPTLPESELNVEVYQDDDISEAVASIPEDTPITYQAGYPGDMSPARKFYISGQITWEDNVLKIQAVDAVHFLDKSTTPISIGAYNDAQDIGANPTFLAIAMVALLRDAGVSFADAYFPWSFYTGKFTDIGAPRSVIGGETYRETIAQIMNIAHFDDLPSKYFRPIEGRTPPTAYWINYVDAGRPRLTREKPVARWVIFQDDVAGFKRNIEPVLAKMTVPNKSTNLTSGEQWATDSNSQVGTVEWRKNEGAFVSLDDNVARFTFGLSAADGVTPKEQGANVLPIIPCSDKGRTETVSVSFVSSYCSRLYNSETQQRNWDGSLYTGVQYTQIVPWGTSFNQYVASQYRWRTQAEAWAGLVNLGIIPTDADSMQLKIFGAKVVINENETEYNADREGLSVQLDRGWTGTIGFYESDTSSKMVEALPKMGYESLFSRSNVTCSFTWKGDPRIQPRDVFTFHRLDGTDEEWTFENITITHEGGGTSAEITARKGIV